jgi:hypothetical protein
MCDRLPPQRIDARNKASLGHMAARAQAWVHEDRSEAQAAALVPDGQLAHEGVWAEDAVDAIRLEDWARLTPEDRFAQGAHAPAWPDLPTPQKTRPAPAWTSRLAAWLREAEQAPEGTTDA